YPSFFGQRLYPNGNYLSTASGAADWWTIEPLVIAGLVEVHVASRASNYQTRILETQTTFAAETDGVWLIADFSGPGSADLVFIKTANTPNNLVEVHVASRASNYQTRIYATQTTFTAETDGAWLIADFSGNGSP